MEDVDVPQDGRQAPAVVVVKGAGNVHQVGDRRTIS